MLPRSIAASIAVIILPGLVPAQDGATNGEWRAYGGDSGGTRYSPLSQINATNVADLELAWSWVSVDKTIADDNPDRLQLVRATYFETTPLMIDGVLYGSTSLGQAMAIDAGTGSTLWSYDSESYRRGRPPNLGFISRGVAYWEEGANARIYYNTGDSWLLALNADTGDPVDAFGDGGRVDLTTGVRGARHGPGYGHPSAPIICKGVVIVGSSITDGAAAKEGIPGRIKGFDAETGKLLWTFNIIPEEGEFGTETWKDQAWRYTGGANVWTSMAADDELGYVYLPTSTPTNDFYGGHRLGDGLFAESLVCLDARTGERVWHYQIVHHGVWDYDLPSPPNLIDITVDGVAIKAVAQVTKHGFTFVFDRITGKPVWPIVEREVPQTDVPGEVTSPTQPFPSKPPPFARQGVSPDDVIDFTPELREQALTILSNYKIGPLFTPPGVDKPLITMPGYGGGANWPGAAVDPETGTLYVTAMNHPTVSVLRTADPARSNLRYVRGSATLRGPQGLPLFKPPYATLTAIDLNVGEILWQVTNGGAGPVDHPALAGLDLPPLGTNARAGTLVTKSLVFVTEGSGRSGSATGGDVHLRALDKNTGEVLASFELPGDVTGVPMTYELDRRQFIVVAVGSTPAQLVALSLPER